MKKPIQSKKSLNELGNMLDDIALLNREKDKVEISQGLTELAQRAKKFADEYNFNKRKQVEVHITFSKTFSVIADSPQDARFKAEDKVHRLNKTYKRLGLNYISCKAVK